MKRITIIILMTVLCGICHAQDALFRKYADVNGISTVYISKSMFRMMPNIKAGNKDISRISSKIDKMQILNCERPSLIPSVKRVAKSTYKKGKYEDVMQINENGEHTVIYQKLHPNGKHEFVLFCEEKDELSIINIFGSVTLSEIRNIADN
jgi:hypothetical protein